MGHIPSESQRHRHFEHAKSDIDLWKFSQSICGERQGNLWGWETAEQDIRENFIPQLWKDNNKYCVEREKG